jgi:hypothetical protein
MDERVYAAFVQGDACVEAEIAGGWGLVEHGTPRPGTFRDHPTAGG